MADNRALITGIAGQDGSYLAEFLVEKGYEVHGAVTGVSIEDPVHRLWRLEKVRDRVTLHAAPMESHATLVKLVAEIQPHECYHLAAKSFVSYSFEDEYSTINGNINGALFMLSALRESAPQCKFYFAGSSEMFGNPTESPQDEGTPLQPRSPYGISKTAGYHLTRSYRSLYGLQAWCGILYNHESPRRGREFVTRKITNTVARIKCGKARELRLGNLDATRDWGFAGDYVEAMWLMLRQDFPGDFVISTGESRSVRDFAETAFQLVGLDWRDYVVVDPRFFRPTETGSLRGDSSKAERELGWKPKISFTRLVSMMVEADLAFETDARSAPL